MCESRYTHQGNPKPLYFEENKNRFEKFLHKIIHIVVDDFPQTNDAWVRENYQRNAIFRGLSGSKDDDIIVISDVDEIPNHKSILNYKVEDGITALEQNMYYYTLNCKLDLKWIDMYLV